MRFFLNCAIGCDLRLIVRNPTSPNIRRPVTRIVVCFLPSFVSHYDNVYKTKESKKQNSVKNF